jgi:phosphoglycolate phosphatase
VQRFSLKIGPPGFSPRLVIFDKDGTLIDFSYMWAAWITGLAQRLDSLTDRTVSPYLFHSFGFDPVAARVSADGPLATSSMAALSHLAVDALCEAGLARDAAERAVRSAWDSPDPVKSARPLADLPRVFGALWANGVKIAVATSDDRAATEATLAGLGIEQYVNAIAGADDGLPTKPAPDMVLHLCRILAVAPTQTIVVGDAVADLLMGRAAGAGLAVGVLSGVSSPGTLAPHADVLISSVGDLV